MCIGEIHSTASVTDRSMDRPVRRISHNDDRRHFPRRAVKRPMAERDQVFGCPNLHPRQIVELTDFGDHQVTLGSNSLYSVIWRLPRQTGQSPVGFLLQLKPDPRGLHRGHGTVSCGTREPRAEASGRSADGKTRYLREMQMPQCCRLKCRRTGQCRRAIFGFRLTESSSRPIRVTVPHASRDGLAANFVSEIFRGLTPPAVKDLRASVKHGKPGSRVRSGPTTFPVFSP